MDLNLKDGIKVAWSSHRFLLFVWKERATNNDISKSMIALADSEKEAESH